MKEYEYFQNIIPGQGFTIEEDDGSMKFCYKIIVGNGYHCCLILEDSNFKIEFACPQMLVIK